MAGRLAKLAGHDCYYDTGTSNKSFVMLARDLKKLGVKNWYFMLELNDPKLIDIDPYACDKETGQCSLTKDQVDRIMMECFRNPWYYLREISRIPDAGGTFVQYLANRGNIAQAWCIHKGLDSWLCLRRQKGKTQSALAFEAWMYLFGTSNSTFIFVNKDGENAKANLKRIRDQIDLLPEYMQAKYIADEDGKRTKSRENATKIVNAITKNEIIVKSKATSYDSALSLARGLTAPILHFDEPEFTSHIKTIVANSVSTYETAAARARENNAAHARIFTCTPGDLDTACGSEAQELLNKTLEWSESFYDRTVEEIEEMFIAKGEGENGCNRIIYIEYQWYQIGDTRAWLNRTSASIGDPLVVRRELLLQRLHGSSNSPYSQEDLQYIYEVQAKPIEELWINDYYKFDVYEKLSNRTPYLVGVDCSTGTGSDNNSITIINPYSCKPVAEFESSYIGETKYESLLKSLILDHLPRACLVIERNSVGDGVIDHLLNSPIANNLYFDRNRDLVQENFKGYEETTSMLKQEAVRKSYYGVYTNGSSRESMFAILSRHMNEFKDKFVTKNVTRDIGSLVRTKSGKIEAGPGFHDDSVMSYLIALYVYYHGNNLDYFGIDKGHMEEEDLNQGLRRPDEIDPELVAPELIEEVRKNEESFFNYESLMRDVGRKAQAESFKRQQKLGVTGTDFENSTSETIDDFEGSGSVRIDIFDDLNGINPGSVQNQDSGTGYPDQFDPFSNNPFDPYNNQGW